MTRNGKLNRALAAKHPSLAGDIKDAKWVKVPTAPHTSKQIPSVYAIQVGLITAIAFERDDEWIEIRVISW